MEGKLDPVDAAMAKMFTSELHCEAVDECLQLFGGWGYMWEYPIARAYADARIVKIAGGSIEIMKTIIARQMYSQHGFVLQKNDLPHERDPFAPNAKIGQSSELRGSIRAKKIDKRQAGSTLLISRAAWSSTSLRRPQM